MKLLALRKVIPVHLDDYDRFKSPLDDFKRPFPRPVSRRNACIRSVEKVPRS